MAPRKIMWLLILGCLVLSPYSWPSNEGGLTWLTSAPQAFELAKKSGRYVFVDFSTEWCGWCKKMDRDTFGTSQFKKIAASFVLLKLDGDKERELVRKYGVRGYPTLLILDAQGKQMEAIVGYRTIDQLAPIMEKWAKKSGVKPDEVKPKTPDRQTETTQLPWFDDLDKAMVEASASQKIVMVNVWAEWCEWCKKMDKETFGHADFVKAASAFVLVKVDSDAHEAFCQKYGITSLPTLLFLDVEGNQLQKLTDFQTIEQLLPVMQELVKQQAK